MKKANFQNPEWASTDEDPPGFKAKMYRLGKMFGATRTGTSLYEIPPGEALCPYHYEYGEEEWVLVIEGNPTLRDPDGTHTLEPWDVVFFPRGPEGAHRIQNDSDANVRIIMWSDFVSPSITVYPDSDKFGVWASNEEDSILVRRSSAVDYYDGEVSGG